MTIVEDEGERRWTTRQIVTYAAVILIGGGGTTGGVSLVPEAMSLYEEVRSIEGLELRVVTMETIIEEYQEQRREDATEAALIRKLCLRGDLAADQCEDVEGFQPAESSFEVPGASGLRITVRDRDADALRAARREREERTHPTPDSNR